jgi:hypothetical protein
VAEYRGLLLDFGHVILRTPFELDRVVDDQPANVAGATNAGLAAFRFDVTDVPGSIHLIREHLELDKS